MRGWSDELGQRCCDSYSGVNERNRLRFLPVAVLQVDLVDPLDGVGESDGNLLRGVSDVDLLVGLCEDGGGHDLVVVHAELEVKVGDQVGSGTLRLPQNEVLPDNLSDVAPHGQVLHEELKVVVLVDAVLELFHLIRA